MTDIVEQLEHHASCNAGFDDGELTTKAAAEIKRLRAALVYEENRFGRVGTHDPKCYTWGPSHYDCAMREIESLQDNLAESLHLLEARDMEIERLGEELSKYKASDEMLNECCADLEASQAREAKLRDFIFDYVDLESNNERMVARYDSCVKPTDDIALKEAIKQAKREALLEAADADWWDKDIRVELRRMAGEIE